MLNREGYKDKNNSLMFIVTILAIFLKFEILKYFKIKS